MKRNFLNSFLTGVITSSLVFTPTSFAKPAADASANQRVEELKKVLNETKIDSVKSYSELWQRIQKSNLNKEQLGLIKNVLSALNGQKVPEIKLQEFKYKGKSAIKMISSVQGEQVVVEYLFTSTEAMKVNGIVLTYEDLSSQNKLEAKIKNLSFVKKGFAAFKKDIFSRKITPDLETWNKLSKRQKVEYILRYRQLLEAAQKVYNQSSYKVVSQRTPANDSFFEILLSPEVANAAEGTPAQQEAQIKAEKVADKIQTTEFLGKNKTDGARKGPSCLIAGYAMEWSGNSCKWNTRKNEVFNSPESKFCQSQHGASYVACQPMTYIQSNGNPACVDTKKELQTATHSSGVCDTQSPLISVKDKKNFIDGWLKKIDPSGKLNKKGDKDLIEVRGNKLFTNDKDLFNKITGELIVPLSKYIESAYEVCAANDESNSSFRYKHEDRKSNSRRSPPLKDDAAQDEACNGLLKRALAIKDLFEPIKESGDVVITASDCGDWTPAGSARPGSDGACICDMNKGFKFDASKPKTCVKTGSDSGVAVVEPTEAAGVATEEATVANIDPTCPADASWFSSFIPGNGCKMNGTHWFAAGLTGFAILCLTENIKIDGLCGDKKKNKGSNPQNGNDPVPPPLTPTVTTTVTTPPTDSPRSSEGSTIDTSVDGANGSVPGMAR